MKTLHLIAPFHTVLTPEFDHCAFTAKARRFSTMMKTLGSKYHVIEYANAGSESEADEKVVMLSKDECQSFYRRGKKDLLDQSATIDGPGHRLFSTRLETALRKRLEGASNKEHFVLHMWGNAHQQLAQEIKNYCHVEVGVGHTAAPFGAFRIYESQAWRNHQWGKHEDIAEKIHGTNRYYSWIIPIAYDLGEWPVTIKPETGEKPYFLFLGRIMADKGVYILAHVIRAWFEKHPQDPRLFVFAGRGDFEGVRNECGDWKDRVRYLGPITGEVRRKLIANAEATLAPTKYAEPFGSSAVEGLLCGTPALASDWGAYTETVEHEVNGYRCSLLADWLHALEYARDLDRAAIARDARKRYAMTTLAPCYDRVFERLAEFIGGKGWYA
jgi:glycosyltransferase involved in cell wall biosynthesis